MLSQQYEISSSRLIIFVRKLPVKCIGSRGDAFVCSPFREEGEEKSREAGPSFDVANCPQRCFISVTSTMHLCTTNWVRPPMRGTDLSCHLTVLLLQTDLPLFPLPSSTLITTTSSTRRLSSSLLRRVFFSFLSDPRRSNDLSISVIAVFASTLIFFSNTQRRLIHAV